MQQDMPTQFPHEEEGGLHAEQARRGALSSVIEALRKRECCTNGVPRREGRITTLKLEFEEYP